MSWLFVLGAGLGCYALKVAGAFIPRRWLDRPLIQKASPMLPVALLVALTAVSTFADGRRLTVDARAVGMAAAIVAIVRRLPFLAVVIVAAAVTAAVRALA